MLSVATYVQLTAVHQAPLLEALAIAASALFTGAAIYVSAVEHPARLTLDDSAALQQWKPAYERGTLMQASMAIVAGLLGIASWWPTENLLWLIGAIFILANWPYTLVIIMPVNRQLKAMPDAADRLTRSLLQRWGQLHAGRSLLGAASLILYLWAAAV